MSRTVFITGGSRGIGLELCKKFKANGDTVVTSCRVLTPELEALNIETIPNIDVTKGQDCQTLKQLFNKRQVDILINCAGLLHCETLEQMDFEDILRQFEVNSMAPLRVTHSLLNSLNHGSKVVIVTSRMGSIEDNSSGAYYGYRMSKAAVNMAGKSLANDLFHDGISVGLLHPGFVKTRMTNFSGDVTPEESANNLFNRIEELTLQQSGSFIHANGQKLPW
ncbi:MAG: SDR family oxidoreductase [Lentisphaerales bacterium]|nr:SDR family oxidoreductase [Lentisphaerales bacterium]